MKSLFFVFGILFAQYIIPLLDGIGSLFLTFMESQKAKLSESINESNIRMRQAADREDNSKSPIGFSIPKKEVKEDEENDI